MNESNNKISFKELIENTKTNSDYEMPKEDVFTDSPKKFDAVVWVLIFIAIISIILNVIYYNNALTKVDDDTVAVNGTSISTAVKEQKSQYKNGKIDINYAGVDVLCNLKGIGEAKALSIIAYRETNGHFKSINDIMNVSGIGASIFEKIKDDITV